MRQRLRELSLEDRRQRSIEICEKLARHLDGQKSVALFAPRPTEPDLDLLWELGLLKDRILAYPRCHGNRLLFFAVSGLSRKPLLKQSKSVSASIFKSSRTSRAKNMI